jgi:GNAT superfamily N-acetyltransferase
MEIVTIGSLREYKRFLREVYRRDPMFKDNKSALIDLVCAPRSVFFRNTIQQMIAVVEDGRTLCQCVLVRHPACPEQLMVAFFEALPDAGSAVTLLMDHAGDFGRSLGCTRLVVSLDGHYNYSVGFLQGGSTEAPSFGAAYNPDFYHDYFAQDYEAVPYTSYRDRVEGVQAAVDRSLTLLEGKRGRLELQCADWSVAGFAGTIRSYTELNNTIFRDHRYYYVRTVEEDLALFGAMRLLLRPENLIYAVAEGRKVGFILWYPDFNEFVAPQTGAGVRTFVSYRILRRAPRRVKVVEIGVLPEFEGSGVILQLFARALEMARARFPELQEVMSGWILEANVKSRRITERFMKEPHQRYVAYEKSL